MYFFLFFNLKVVLNDSIGLQNCYFNFSEFNSVTRFQPTFVVCFDSPVVVASSAAPEVKIVNKKCWLKSYDRIESEK